MTTKCKKCGDTVYIPPNMLYIIGAIILFPIGLLCLIVPIRKPCPKCGTECESPMMRLS